MANPIATCKTSLGTFELELLTDKIPVAAGNWIKLARSGFFNRKPFHNAYLEWFSPGPSKTPVFAKVVGGADVIKKIEMTPTDSEECRSEVKMIKITVAD